MILSIPLENIWRFVHNILKMLPYGSKMSFRMLDRVGNQEERLGANFCYSNMTGKERKKMRKKHLAVLLGMALAASTPVSGFASVSDDAAVSDTGSTPGSSEDAGGNEQSDDDDTEGGSQGGESQDGETDSGSQGSGESEDGETDSGSQGSGESEDGETDSGSQDGGENEGGESGSGEKDKNDSEPINSTASAGNSLPVEDTTLSEKDNTKKETAKKEEKGTSLAAEELEALILQLPSEGEFQEKLDGFGEDETEDAKDYLESIREKVEAAAAAREALTDEELEAVDAELLAFLDMWETTAASFDSMTVYADGYAEQVVSNLESGIDVTLTQSIELDSAIEIPADEVVTLNLNGYDIDFTNTTGACIWIEGDLTIEGGGTISAQTSGNTVQVGNYTDDGMSQGASFTFSDAELDAGPFAITVFGQDTEVTINSGSISADYFVISGNGMESRTNHSSITINGGDLRSDQDVAIYHPQRGDSELVINGGTITGDWAGVQICSGSLTVDGDDTVIAATGGAEFPEKEEEAADGSVNDGAALSLLSRPGYGGDITVDIQGGTFQAVNYPIKYYAAQSSSGKVTIRYDYDSQIEEFSISGGTFIGGEGVIWDGYRAGDENGIEDIDPANFLSDIGDITGGYYSHMLDEAYLQEGYLFAQTADGAMYELVEFDSTIDADSGSDASVVESEVKEDTVEVPSVSGAMTEEQQKALEEAKDSLVSTASSEISSNQAVSGKPVETTGNVTAQMVNASLLEDGEKAVISTLQTLKDIVMDAQVEYETDENGNVKLDESGRRIIKKVTPYISRMTYNVEAAYELQHPDTGSILQEKKAFDLNGMFSITFRIPIPSSVNALYANVAHISDQGTERFQETIHTENGGKYIEITTDHFSDFELTFTNVKETSERPENVYMSSGGSGGDSDWSDTWVPEGSWEAFGDNWKYKKGDGTYAANGFFPLLVEFNARKLYNIISFCERR